MHTPYAAFSWELWRRHRPRIIAIIGLVLGFALLYPKLCTLGGFNRDSPDALEEIAKRFATGSQGMEVVPSALMVFRILFLLFLACGPAVAMVTSLLFVTWMFTFTELDPRTKDPMTFPTRLFTLPVSTSALFAWLSLAGMASVAVLSLSWILCVRMPHVDIFAAYQNVFGWLALLALTQGTVLALAGWPKTRLLILSGILFGFLYAPGWRAVYESPLFLTPAFLLGMGLAGAGLHKTRHGQWQAWPFGAKSARAEMRGPPQFASPAQAQLWFEWRRFGRPLCFTVAGLALVPVTILLLARGVFFPKPFEDVAGLAIYLIAIPAVLHFCFGMAPPRADLPFLMNRPLTNGEMMMASLKAAGIGTLFSWGLVLVALCAELLLGDWRSALKSAFDSPRHLAIITIGLVFLTWRSIPVNLGFAMSGKRRLMEMPAWMLVAFCLGFVALALLSQVDEYWNVFCRLVPALLVGLIALKFSLAYFAFRVCLKRRFIAPSALVGYLGFWIVLVAMLMTTLVMLWPPAQQGMLPASLAVVLLVPLARIGFCPIALAWNRHA